VVWKGLNNSAGKRVLNLLEAGYLRGCRYNKKYRRRVCSERWRWGWYRCCGIEVRANATKLMNTTIAEPNGEMKFRVKRREVFIKDEDEVASRVGGVE